MDNNASAKSNNCNSKKIVKPKSKLWNMNFILLWQGQFVSNFGDSIYDIALGFWILAKTGSTGLMGILMATAVIPRVFLSPIAGTYVDRHNRKNILIVTDVIRGIVISFVGVAAVMNFIQIWMVLMGGIVLGICGSFFNPAVQSSIPDLVPKDKLVKANSTFSLASTGTDIIGKTLGGFLFHLIGAPIMFLINGISYIFSACTELFIKIPNKKRDINKVKFFEDLKSGFNYVKSNKGIKYLYITIAILNFFAIMGITLLLPLFNSKQYLGPERYGVAMAFSTGGMFLGFLILSIVDLSNIKKSLIFIAGGLINGLAMGILPHVPNYFIIVILLFINGFSVAIINSIIQSTMQVAVSDDMRGKVFGFRRTLSSSLVPMAMAIGGILAEFISISIIISVGFSIIFILFFALGFIKPVKKLIDNL